MKENKNRKSRWNAKRIYTPEEILKHYSTFAMFDIYMINQESELEWAHWAKARGMKWPAAPRGRTYPYQRTIKDNAAIPTSYMSGYDNSNGKGWPAMMDPPENDEAIFMTAENAAMHQRQLALNLGLEQMEDK